MDKYCPNICKYCKKSKRLIQLCRRHNGRCFAPTKEAHAMLESLKWGIDPDGNQMYRFQSEADFELACLMLKPFFTNYDEFGPGVYHFKRSWRTGDSITFIYY